MINIRSSLILSVSFWVVFVIFGCSETKDASPESEHKESFEQSGYDDGRYCATVNYYNPGTGTQSTYTLEVEIESNELIKIYWPNGGWLDDSHFVPPDISDGSASFSSDAMVDYEVQIEGREGDCNLSGVIYEEDASVDQESQ